MFKSLPIALFLIALPSCSKPPVAVPMPPPPANLARQCPQLPPLPSPLIDPERAFWEGEVLTAYAECAARHSAAVAAWLDAVKATR